MPKQLRWKWIVILCVLVGCIAGVVGFPASKEALKANWNKSIRLGLDLKGGSHIVMQVQVQDAFKAEADRAIERLGEALRKAQVGFVAMERNEPASVEAASTIEISVKGVPAEQISEFRRIAGDSIGDQWTLLPSGAEQRFAIRKEIVPQLIQDTITQSINTMERKVNGLGVAETNIQQRGGNEGVEILIQLPGLDDPARVKGILQTSAILELNSVVSEPYPSQEAAIAAHNGILPSNAKLVRGSARAGGGVESWWLVSRSPVVSGRDLRDARAEPSDMPGRWDTGFVLIPAAAERFGRFTEANINNRLAIVLDNVLLSAPVIESRISDSGRITGAATREEAADLALNLRAGSLPAGVKIIEERTVGPSLGADSIRRGIGAGLAGLALVIASMLAYYRGAGLNAVLALLLNTVVTVAALSYFEATWTLPGIAGLVLSIGMAVDSNVLIFERIKEELRAGKRPASAVSSGFDRALVTIIDTHVTTVVASAFLFVFGTGPVRGFAVTLVIGLIANLFTAVYVSRAIFDLQLWRNPKLEKLSLGGSRRELFRNSGIDFMRRRRLTLGISIVMIAISLAAMLGPGLQPGLDFRGGALVNVRFTDKPPIDELRGQLSGKISGEIAVQDIPGSNEFIIGTGLQDEESLAGTREKVQQALQEKYADRFDIRSAEIVTPKAGEQMRRQAMMATIGALGGMLIYIAFRFKWISGVAAVIATVHDVIITLGLFALAGREINLNIIAALLTLIGYSMNDKIVVFDRVRENLLKNPRAPFLEVVNLSINQTLSRTLLTAGPTLLACLALYFLGGEVLNGIAFALFTGIIAGTYSSIFVASSLMVIWNERRKRVRGPAVAPAK